MGAVQRVEKRHFHFISSESQIAIRRVPEWRSCLRERNALICFHFDLKRPSPTPTANTSDSLEVNEEKSTEHGDSPASRVAMISGEILKLD